MAGPWEKYAKAGPAAAPSAPVTAGPWTKYAAKAEPSTGAGQAALESFGNMGLMGYLPQAQAGIESLTPDPNAALNEKLKAQGFNIQEPESGYLSARDANIARQAKQIEEHPYAAGAGGLAGAIATAPLAAGALPKLGLLSKVGAGAGMKAGAARVAQAGLQGAELGLLSNPGDVQGQMSPIQAEERLAAAKQGGLLGGAVGGGAEALKLAGPAVLAAGGKVRKYAQEKAFKALGPYQRDVLRNKARVTAIGGAALDKGIITGKPTSYEKMADKAKEAYEEVGKDLDVQLNKIADAAEEMASGARDGAVAIPGQPIAHASVGVDPRAVADALRQELIDTTGLPGAGSVNQLYESMILELESRPGLISIREAQKLKLAAGEAINWKRIPGADIPDKEKFYRSFYEKIKRAVEDAAEGVADILGPGARAKYVKTKQTYGALKEAEKIARNRSSREFANRTISLTDYGTGMAGAVVGATTAGATGGDPSTIVTRALIGGIAGALLNKGSRRYLNQVQAHAALKVADILETNGPLRSKYAAQLQQLVTQKPERMVSVLYQISRDPGFIKAQKELPADE